MEECLDIDPLTPVNNIIASWIEQFAGNFDTAVKVLNRVYQIDMNNPFFRYWYVKGLAYNNCYEEVVEICDLFEKDSQKTIFHMLGVFLKYAIQGNKAKALQSFQSFPEKLRKKAQTDEIFPLSVADAFALIDEKDKAIDWLEQGLKRGFINYHFLNEIDPFLANIRGEPRFKKLMERVKHEWENFEV
jgi:hypothetical protein